MKGAEFWLEHVLGKREKDTAQRKAAENQRMAREMEVEQSKKKGGKGKKKLLPTGGVYGESLHRLLAYAETSSTM